MAPPLPVHMTRRKTRQQNVVLRVLRPGSDVGTDHEAQVKPAPRAFQGLTRGDYRYMPSATFESTDGKHSATQRHTHQASDEQSEALCVCRPDDVMFP